MSPVDDIEADLDDHMSGRDLPETFRVTDDATAGWALGKLHAIETEQARIEVAAANRRAAVTEWETFALKPLADSAAFFTRLLEDYRRQLREQDPKAPATYKLPEGDLVWAKGTTVTETTDVEAFARFADEYGTPDLVAYTPKVKAKELQTPGLFARTEPDADGVVRLITPAGEVVPGVQLRQKPDSVRVKTSTPVAEITEGD